MTTTATAKEWFLASGDKKVGPMTKERVLERLADGKVPSQTKAWREGMGEWLPVREIPEFGGEAPSPAVAEAPARPKPPRRSAIVVVEPEPRKPFEAKFRIEARDIWRGFALGFDLERVKVALLTFGAIFGVALLVAGTFWLHPILGALVGLLAGPASIVVTSLGLGALSYQTRRQVEDGATPRCGEALRFATRHLAALALAPVVVTLLALVPPLALGLKSLLTRIPSVGTPIGGLSFGVDLVLSATMIFLAIAAGLAWYFCPIIVAFEETRTGGTVRALLDLVKRKAARILLWSMKPALAFSGLALVYVLGAAAVVAAPIASEYPVVAEATALAPPAAAPAPPSFPKMPMAARGPSLPSVEPTVGFVGIVGWTALLLLAVIGLLTSTANALAGLLYVGCRSGNDDLVTRDSFLARSTS